MGTAPIKVHYYQSIFYFNICSHQGDIIRQKRKKEKKKVNTELDLDKNIHPHSPIIIIMASDTDCRVLDVAGSANADQGHQPAVLSADGHDSHGAQVCQPAKPDP